MVRDDLGERGVELLRLLLALGDLPAPHQSLSATNEQRTAAVDLALQYENSVVSSSGKGSPSSAAVQHAMASATARVL